MSDGKLFVNLPTINGIALVDVEEIAVIQQDENALHECRLFFKLGWTFDITFPRHVISAEHLDARQLVALAIDRAQDEDRD